MMRVPKPNQILFIDLSSNKVWTEELDGITLRQYVGGGGLACYLLLRYLPNDVDPLSPDNLLVITTSILTGYRIPGVCRFMVASKSPLTGGYGESGAGGWWGPELRSAGFLGIVVKGKGDTPKYIWIDDDKVEILDAGRTWGKSTRESQEMIRGELGDNKVRVLQIGPAGEKLVRYACIVNELRHINGRTGMGAVMGSKLLKAIAVRGSQHPFSNPLMIEKNINDWFKQEYTPQPGDLDDLGTSRSVPEFNASGILPTRNFLYGEFGGAQKISGQRIKKEILVERSNCFSCPILCKRNVKVDSNFSPVNPIYGGPEYETVASLGALLEIDNLDAVAKGNELCNAYGLDTISTGVSIAFAMECVEKGILTPNDCQGIDLRFGKDEAMLEMIEMIARREGLGDLLAEGVARAAERVGKGSGQFAMHIKGQEVPTHEARGKRSLVFAYSISPTGADHMEAPHDVAYEFDDEQGIVGLSPLGLLERVSHMDMGPKKARAFYYSSLLWNLYNSLGLCVFVGAPLGPFSITKLVECVREVTGWETSLWELLKVGERAMTMARVFNFKQGFTKGDDYLPERLFEPLQKGALKGVKIDRDEFTQMLTLFYEMCGWDTQGGFPLTGKLVELGLEWTM